MTIDTKKFNKLVDEKYISVQRHPTEELYIWNYTQKCQFERMWTDETMMARGLITDKDGNIKARPFKKFFNYSEHVGEDSKLPPLPVEDFDVFDKMDGSLGISYWNGNLIQVATRGSFVSEQAIWACKKLKDYPQLANTGLTFLWEIIYPGNRIVVDYKGMEDLVLLSAIKTETGEEISYDLLPTLVGDWPTVKRFDGINDLEKIKEINRENAEGFVIRFKSGMRTKIKYDEYVRLHRLVTGVNAKTIWELLRNGQSLDEFINRVPDEFYHWVKKTASDLNNEYEVIEQVICKNILEEVNDLPTRKDQAVALMNDPENKKYSSIVFKMLDKQPYEDIIWKMIKPRADKPYKEDIDA